MHSLLSLPPVLLSITTLVLLRDLIPPSEALTIPTLRQRPTFSTRSTTLLRSSSSPLISNHPPPPPTTNSEEETELYYSTLTTHHDTPINCIHFQDCPGCTVNSTLTSIPLLSSAKLYFSSSSIRPHFIHPQNQFQTILPSRSTEWRTTAKLAVSPTSNWSKSGCTFGLYERGTHTVLSIPECRVHHPQINRAVEVLRQATSQCQTEAFQESTGDGDLRYVQLQLERHSSKVVLVLIWNADQMKYTQPGLSRLVKEIKRRDGKLWHSIWCHLNDGLGNNIFSRGEGKWHKLDGPEYSREALPGSVEGRKDGLLYFTPMAFRQGNMDGFDVIARHVASKVPKNAAVCELYAGVGVLGLTALSSAYHRDWDDGSDDEEDVGYRGLRWLHCSDENPANPRCFERSVGSMPIEVTGRPPKQYHNNKTTKSKHKRRSTNKQQTSTLSIEDLLTGTPPPSSTQQQPKVTYTVSTASSALHKGQALGADVLIVDPPRKGLCDEVLTQLCKPFDPNQPEVDDLRFLFRESYKANLVNDVKMLIYVSCGFDALARDCDKLLGGNAGWKIESVKGFVLFPGSNHVETVVVFKRRGRRV